jgi:Uma2 family endonuclease
MEVFRGARRGAPDLAIEIVSPNDTADQVERKIDQYLAAGTAAVALLYRETRHVRVCRPSGEARRLGAEEWIELPELAPDLKIPVAAFFAAK